MSFIGIRPAAEARAQSTPPPAIDLTQVKALYASAQYVQVADSLTPYLKQNPNDSRARAVLILALLKLDEKDLARTELNTLEANKNDARAVEYARQLEGLILAKEQEREKKQEIYRALSNYDAARASDLVKELPLSPLHKGILLAYIDIYRGDFSNANAQLQGLNPESLSDRRAIKQIAQQVKDDETESERLHSEISAYLYSEVTASSCNSEVMTHRYPKGGPFITAADFQHYIENVTKLSVLTPLDPQVMDFVFHVTLLGGDYKNTEIVGDALIRGKGNIRIPFISESNYFYVVLDSRKRHIYTEPDNTHNLQVLVDIPAILPTDYTPLSLFHRVKKHNNEARWYEKETPFDLEFGEITGISQQAKDWRGGLQGKAFALKLSPQGLAPNYLLMNVLACVFGEAAQRSATRSLGLFVQHVAAPHNIQMELVDPSKHTFDIWGEGHFGSMIASMYGATAAKYGSSSDLAMASMVSQAMTQEEASKQQYDQSQRDLSTKWFAQMKTISDGFQEVQNLVEVEKLLQLQ